MLALIFLFKSEVIPAKAACLSGRQGISHWSIDQLFVWVNGSWDGRFLIASFVAFRNDLFFWRGFWVIDDVYPEEGSSLRKQGSLTDPLASSLQEWTETEIRDSWYGRRRSSLCWLQEWLILLEGFLGYRRCFSGGRVIPAKAGISYWSIDQQFTWMNGNWDRRFLIAVCSH